MAKPDSNANTTRVDIHRDGLLSMLRAGDPASTWFAMRLVNARHGQDPAVMHAAGIGAARLGQTANAERYLRRAIELHPHSAEPHNDLAMLLQALARLREAVAEYRIAIDLKPDWADPVSNLAAALIALGQPVEGERMLRAALDLNPDHSLAHYNLGLLLASLSRTDEAEAAYRQAITHDPGYALAHNNLGRLLEARGAFDDAEQSYRAAIAAQPDNAIAHNNLGRLLEARGAFDEAEHSFRTAIAAQPDNAIAHNNLGKLLMAQQRPDEAEAALRQALARNPSFLPARWNLGLLMLSMERYAEGWPLYETRADRRMIEWSVTPPTLPYPQWQGESLVGKSLSIWCEQGHGDEIQFVRYLPMLRAAGASRITLICKPALHRLFAANALADRVLPMDQSDQAGPHDYWTLLLSVPGRVGTTSENLRAAIPYLRAPRSTAPDRRREPALRVGLVWKTGVATKNAAARSLPGLAVLAPLWAVPGVTFFSLQKGQDEEPMGRDSPDQPLIDLAPGIADFADTAARIESLDLVISVDTAVAHLSGALGKPTWVLLSRVGSDWRWPSGRRDSPWYPGVMRLFRQPASCAWEDVVSAVAQALGQEVQQRGLTRSE